MFTLADFPANEDENYHTENGIEMAKHFGTPEELELMMQIQKDHYARGHIEPSEIEARNAIVQKYWHHLSGVEDIKEDDDEKGTEHYRAKDKQHTDHVKAELEELMSHLDLAITFRYKHSHLMLGNGNKAGTGEMYRLKEQLEKIHASWDEATELYGM